MSDPGRWSDGADDAPLGAREALGGLRRPPPLTDAVFARTAARVGALASSPRVPPRPRAWWFGAGLAAVGVVAVLAALLASRRRPTSAPAVAPAVAPSALVVAPPARASSTPPETVSPSAPPAEATAPLAAVPARRSPTARSPLAAQARAARVLPSASAPPARPSAEPAAEAPPAEMELLVAANRSLARRDPAAALAGADAMRRLYPEGSYAQERERVAVLALAALGRADDARARGEAYLARYPEGIYAAPIRRLVGAAR